MRAEQEVILMRIGVFCDRDTDFALIWFSDVDQDPSKHRLFGSARNNSLRYIYTYIDGTFDASRLLMKIG